MDARAGEAIQKDPTSNLFARYWPIWSFVAVMLFCGGFSFLREPLRSYRAGKKLAADIPLARAAGVPLHATDVKAASVPAGQNAGPLLQDALKQMDSVHLDDRLDSTYIPHPHPGTAQDQANLSLALSKAEEAASKPACDMGYDPDELQLDKRFPDLGFARLIKVLCARAADESSLGKSDLALKDLQTATKLCEFFESPSMLRLATHDQSRQLVLMTMELVMSRNATNPDALNKIRDMAASMETNLFPVALRGQAYLEIAAARNLDQLEARQMGSNRPIDPRLLVRQEVPPSSHARELTDRELQSWTRLFNKLKGSDPAKMLTDITDFETRHPGDVDWYDIPSSFSWMNPSYISGYQKERATNALAQSMEALAAVLSYKATQGHYPPSLREAAGKDFPDVFSGKNLHYKVSGEAVRVYSFGPVGWDGGGLRRGEVGVPAAKGHLNIGASYPPYQRDPHAGVASLGP